MTTLMAVFDSEGCVGRCDAICYDAKHETCLCICGGVNHGKGLAKASQNFEENQSEIVTTIKADYPDCDVLVEIQLALPGFFQCTE